MANCSKQANNSDEADHHFPDAKTSQKSSASKEDL